MAALPAPAWLEPAAEVAPTAVSCNSGRVSCSALRNPIRYSSVTKLAPAVVRSSRQIRYTSTVRTCTRRPQPPSGAATPPPSDVQRGSALCCETQPPHALLRLASSLLRRPDGSHIVCLAGAPSLVLVRDDGSQNFARVHRLDGLLDRPDAGVSERQYARRGHA